MMLVTGLLEKDRLLEGKNADLTRTSVWTSSSTVTLLREKSVFAVREYVVESFADSFLLSTDESRKSLLVKAEVRLPCWIPIIVGAVRHRTSLGTNSCNTADEVLLEQGTAPRSWNVPRGSYSAIERPVVTTCSHRLSAARFTQLTVVQRVSVPSSLPGFRLLNLYSL